MRRKWQVNAYARASQHGHTARVRLFVAVDLPPEVAGAVARMARPEDRNVRWTRADQWHVTLRFLGELDRGVLEGARGLVAALDSVPSALARAGGLPASAVLGPKTAWFPGRHVLQVPVAGLDLLAGAVATVTAEWGRPPDEPFRGHLTVARARGQSRGPASLAGAPIEGRWDVGELLLYRSIPGSGGHRYEVLHRVALEG